MNQPQDSEFTNEELWLNCDESAREVYLCVKKECFQLPDSLGPNRGEPLKEWKAKVEKFIKINEGNKKSFKSWLITAVIFLVFPISITVLGFMPFMEQGWLISLGVGGYFIIGIFIFKSLSNLIMEEQVHSSAKCLLFQIDHLFGKKIDQIKEKEKDARKKQKMEKFRGKMAQKFQEEAKEDSKKRLINVQHKKKAAKKEKN